MSTGHAMAAKINDVLATKTKEEVDWFLKEFSKGLKDMGIQETSFNLMMNRDQPWAVCVPCEKAFLISEFEAAGGCPDCGQTEEFKIPELITQNDIVSGGAIKD